MKLKDIYKLDGELVFGPTARYHQDFSNAWFEDILELRFNAAELDQKGLALAGRLTAVRIMDMSEDGEYSARVTKLMFDGYPFALHGESGDYLETAYLKVTNEQTYREAESHVREFLLKPACRAYDKASEDDEHSLQGLFGFYYSSMADAARERVIETFGQEAASTLLGLEAPERDRSYYLLKTERARINGVPASQCEAILGYVHEDSPAAFISYGDNVFQYRGAYEDEAELKILRSVFHNSIASWWVYDRVPAADVTGTIVRI